MESIDKPGKLWVSQDNQSGTWLRCHVVSKTEYGKRLVRIEEGSLKGAEMIVHLADVRVVEQA